MSRLSFVVEYHDPQASLMRQYQLLFFPEDSSVEMYDLKNKRMFLKRCPYPQLSKRDLVVGTSITIFSRVLHVVDYGDEATRRLVNSQAERLLLLVTDEGAPHLGKVLKSIVESSVHIVQMQLCVFSPTVASMLPQPIHRAFVIDCSGSNLTEKSMNWQRVSRGIHAFTDVSSTEIIRCAAFESPATSATLSNCSCCVIKPHAIAAYGGDIVQRIIDEGFHITAFGSFNLSRADAEDFAEIYAGVLPEYKKMVDQISSGQCWAMELKAENVVAALRAVCGPHDPEICRVLFPDSLRAIYGEDRVKNAVHCTDLPEDGPLESEFFFNLLATKP